MILPNQTKIGDRRHEATQVSTASGSDRVSMIVAAQYRSIDPVASARGTDLRRALSEHTFGWRLFWSLLTLILLFCPLRASAQEPAKRVLILTGSDPNRPGFQVLTRGVQSTLRDRASTRVEVIYELQQGLLDNTEAESGDQELVSYLKRKYANQKIDLLLVLVASRFRIILQKDPTLFANVPKVFYDFDNEREVTNRSLGPNITGVWASLDRYRATLDLAFALRPDTRKVVVISGANQQNRIVMEQAKVDFRSYESRAEFSYLIGETMGELKRQLAALDNRSIVVFASYSSDKLGNNYTLPEAFSMAAPVSAAPIFGTTETLMGLGIVGGRLLDFEATGKRIGEMSLRILAGEKPEQISQETAPSVTTVDWRELRRWGISEERLPPGSVVKFKQLSFWELYKWYAIGLMAAVFFEALLIAWLLFIRARRREAEKEILLLARQSAADHQRLDEIVSNVPGVVWETVVDPETNQRRTTFISDYLRKMLGYTPQEWMADSPGLGWRIMPEEDREKAMRESEAVIASGKEGQSQFRWRGKDGRIVWTESYLTPMSDEQRKVVGLRGVTLDITERKLAEESLRKTEEKDRAILKAIPDLMFLHTRDGIYLDYHAKDHADLFVPPEEFLGKNIRDVLPAELAEKFLVCYERTAETDEPQILEYKLCLNGKDRWFEGRIVRSGENMLTMVREITQRVAIENALQENEAQLVSMIHSAMEVMEELHRSEERFAKAFRANPQPMSLTTMANGRYLDVNESFLAMSGYSREEVIGHTSLELDVWETSASRVDFLGRFNEGSLANVETTFRTKKGSLRHLLSSAERLEIDGEDCLLMASSDITERMIAQQALQESEERFRNMADTAPVMIWVTGTDKLATYVNQQYLDFTGRTLERELGNGWAEGVHRDDLERCLETYASAFDRREPFQMEFRLRRADGAYRWILSGGAPRFSSTREFLGYIGSSMDITDRRESEEALRSTHELVIRLKNQLQEENIYLKEEINLGQNFGEIVGHSDALKYVLFKIEQVAPTETTVLITGETGTGKELVARAIHKASARRERPMVKVNCAALSASLIESELFGHEKGAFTGASARKIGRFELADGATIFLDEIGELPIDLQVKLLRVIQEGEFERLGSARTIKADVRIIAATNRNLDVEVKKGLFREDLWYRLNVFPITVPPLRDRQEDVPQLVEHFAKMFSNKLGKVITSISPTTMKTLDHYSWPGNVRELANVIERAVINSHGPVLRIVDEFFEPAVEKLIQTTKTLEELERDYISRILSETGWRIEGRHGAARILGLNPSTLRARVIKLGIHKPGQGQGIHDLANSISG